MKVFGVLMKHIEPNSRAWAILGDLVKCSDPIAIFKKLKETYDADSTAGFFEIMEKFFDPPLEEDLLHFLNRKYKELDDFGDFGKKSTVNAGVTMTKNPHKISETVRVLMVFAMTRKVHKYAIELDDFVTENLFVLDFDSADLKFSILYEKLVKFLRNREIVGIPKEGQIESAVFTAEGLQRELDSALQAREDEKTREKINKRKKPLGQTQDFVEEIYRGEVIKRRIWHCEVHGRQTDHSSKYCPVLHPELLEEEDNQSDSSEEC